MRTERELVARRPLREFVDRLLGRSNVIRSKSGESVHITSNTVKMYDSSGAVKFRIDDKGNLLAHTKSFCIDHPLKEGKNLVHGCLEGPENAAYYRGSAFVMSTSPTIRTYRGNLPDYWNPLVNDDYDVFFSGVIVVNLKKFDGYFTFDLVAIGCPDLLTVRYMAIGSRRDAPLEIVQDKIIDPDA